MKPYTVDETTATPRDWLNCYGYLIAENPLWLAGMPGFKRERGADRVAQSRSEHAYERQSVGVFDLAHSGV